MVAERSYELRHEVKCRCFQGTVSEHYGVLLVVDTRLVCLDTCVIS